MSIKFGTITEEYISTISSQGVGETDWEAVFADNDEVILYDGTTCTAGELTSTAQYTGGDFAEQIEDLELLFNNWEGVRIDSPNGQTTGTPAVAVPYALSFNPDGTRVYILDGSTDDIFQFDLTTPWDIDDLDISSGSVAGQTTGSPAATNPRDIFFKPDGTRVYILDNTVDDIFQFDLTTAWDIDGLDLTTADGQTTGTPAITSVLAFFFKPDGTRVYISDFSTGDILQFDLTTAWDIDGLDISSGSVDGQTTGSPAAASPYGLFFKPDGTRVYIIDSITEDIFQHDLTTAWDIDGLDLTTADGQTTDTPALTAILGFFFKPDGTRVYILDFTFSDIYQFDVGSLGGGAWDIDAPAQVQKSLVSNDGISNTNANANLSIFFRPDGKRLYNINGGDNIEQIDLATAWDITSEDIDTTDGVTTGTRIEADPTGLFFKPDGTRFYIIGTTQKDVIQYDLTTPWDIDLKDISTADGQTIGSSQVAQTPQAIFFRPNGLRLFILDEATGSDDIFQFDLSTAWDIDGLDLDSHDGVTTGTPAAANPKDFHFSPDGLRLFIIDDGDIIYQYHLDTAWDISSFSLTTADWVTTGTPSEATNDVLHFNNTGTRFYMGNGGAGSVISQFDLVHPWTIRSNISTNPIDRAPGQTRTKIGVL
jgi:DNA-binding beta-propeller fold protein YncE